MDQTHTCICKGTPTHTGVQKYIGKLLGHCLFFLNEIILHGLMSTLTLLTQKYLLGASLVAQWLRVCLPMQGTRVRALVWEDPTCRRATRPVSHNY